MTMLFGLCSGLAVADSLEWSMTVQPQSTLDIELELQDGTPLFRILSADNHDRRNFGWRPDTAREEGLIEGSFPQILLGPGNYTLTYHTEMGSRKEVYQPTTTASRFLPVMLPEAATGVIAFHHSANGEGLDGFAYAPSQGGVAFLPLDERDEWMASPLSTDVAYEPQNIQPDHGSLSFHPQRKPQERPSPSENNFWIRFLLFPITLICLASAGVAIKAYVKQWRIHLLAIAAGLMTGLYAIQNSLFTLSSSITMRGAGFEDPPTSATLLWSLTNSLSNLSEHSSTFSFPEGHSWLIMGPSWLGYILSAPICWLTDAVVAHNLGIVIFSSLNFYCAWLLARTWGANPLFATLAGFGATLSPTFLSEIDTLSLDRCILFPIPLFLLCVEQLRKTDELPLRKQMPAIFGGGVVLCTALLSQIYYGIYLAAAAPLLILPRLMSRRFLIRIRSYAMMGGFTILLMTPLLVLLQNSTQDTVYDEEVSLRDVVEDPLSPIEPQIVKERLEAIVQTGHRQMNTPEDRLIAALSNSLYPKDVYSPAEYFYGAQFYWFLVLLAVLVSSKKKDTLTSGWDALVLCTMALGPLAKTPQDTISTVLPYYFYHLYVPGFEQLKHPYRFIIMASMISTIPIVLGFQSIVERHKKHTKWLTPLLFSIGLSLVVIRQAPPERNVDIHTNMPFMEYYWARFKSLPQFDIALREPSVPASHPIPEFTPLQKIAGEPAIVFPFVEPLPVDLYLGTTRNKIPLINAPPHGSDPGRQQTSLLEQNSFLNTLAWLSGSDRQRRKLYGGVERSIEQLREIGVKHIIVFPDHLPGKNRWTVTEKWLQKYTTLTAADDTVSVWAL